MGAAENAVTKAEYGFFVPGVPAPGGSKRHIGRGRIIEDCKRTPAWRSVVALAAMQAGCVPLEGALALHVKFMMPRPKGHMRKDGTLKPSAPKHPIVKPDTTKLMRALEDALTGICWRDDTQVVIQTAHKAYAAVTCGAFVRISQLDSIEEQPCRE